MTEAQKTKLKNAAIGLAIAYGIFRFIDNKMVQAAAAGVMGVIVANNVPYTDAAVKGI